MSAASSFATITATPSSKFHSLSPPLAPSLRRFWPLWAPLPHTWRNSRWSSNAYSRRRPRRLPRRPPKPPLSPRSEGSTVGGYDQDLSRIVEELNRAAPGTRVTDKPSTPRPPQNTGSLDQLLSFASRQNASDLLLIAGTPVALRVNGTLAPAAGPPLSPEDVRNFVLPLLDSRQYDELQKRKSVDFCFVRDPVGRFRANIHHQRGTLAASIRLLPAHIPTIESLHLPAALTRIADRRQGLILVTGATGSGKSSTLAALIDLINTRRRTHIVTIEDPVEYQHTNRSFDRRTDRSGTRYARFRQFAAQHSAADSRRHSGWRNARCGNHGHRAYGRRDRTSGVFHAAYQRRRAVRIPHPGFVSRRASGADAAADVAGAAGGDRATTGARRGWHQPLSRA